MSVEEEHFDVLQNMEFEIVQIYRWRSLRLAESTSDLIDAEVLNAIESLIHIYNLEVKGGFAASPKVKGISATVAAAVKDACEIRLGRGSNADELIEPKTVQNIVDCLKRIQSSIKFWTKKSGRKGYLDYINKFIQ
jgi:hypothetical protein